MKKLVFVLMSLEFFRKKFWDARTFLFLAFIVVCSSLVLAEDTDNCAGFFDSIKCFLWGDSDAGRLV